MFGSRTALVFDWLKRKIIKHKNFLNSGIGVAGIFDWGWGAIRKSRQYDAIRNFQKQGLFIGQKYLRMEDQKSGALVGA